MHVAGAFPVSGHGITITTGINLIIVTVAYCSSQRKYYIYFDTTSSITFEPLDSLQWC